MSTIENILQSLHANSADKKNTLTAYYNEKSVWMRNEFEVIKKLIKQNPRENLGKEAEVIDAAALDLSTAPSGKRSREASLIKQSPAPKRTSIDVEDLVRQAGLPSDLNKMKKEQLLIELESRGNFSLSMKNVKQAMIDALKDTLLQEHQSRSVPVQPEAVVVDAPSVEKPSSTFVEADTSMVLSTPSKPAQVRKGSLMSDFRSKVTNSEMAVTPGKPDVEQKKKIEDEYNARMHRQRESVAARQSVLGMEPVVVVAASVSPVEAPQSAVVKTEASPIVVAPAPAVVEASQQEQEQEQQVERQPKESLSSVASGDSHSNGSIWMEVSSPMRSPEKDSDREVVAEAEPQVVARPRTESDASFQSCASTGSNVPKVAATTTTSATSTTASGSGSAKLGVSSVRPASSKVTYTEKSAVTKSVQPTLMKAKLATRPEDVKAAPVLVKKAALPVQETKPVIKHSSSSSSISSIGSSNNNSVTHATAQSVRPVATTAPVAVAAPAVVSQAPVPVVGAAVGAVTAPVVANEAPVKRGIFGFLSNSKKIVSTPTAAPATSSLFSPTAKPAPAMVDSIIKAETATAAPASAAKATPSPTEHSSKPATAVSSTPLNNGLASKSLISNIVNNYNNALKTSGPISTPAAAPKPVSAPSASAPVLRDITATTTAPAVKAAPPAPSTAAPVHAPVVSSAPVAAAVVHTEEYVIEDRDDSDESGTDGEGEEDPNNPRRPKQNVPDWARGPLLKEALERQYGLGGQVPMDPDLIFPEVTTCVLEEIFGAREGINRKYAARSSSAHWDADQLNPVEKRVYRKHMGYDRNQQAPGSAMK